MLSSPRWPRWLVVATLVVNFCGGRKGWTQDSLGDPSQLMPTSQASMAKNAYTHVLDPLGDRIRGAASHQESMMRLFEHAMTTEFLFDERDPKKLLEDFPLNRIYPDDMFKGGVAPKSAKVRNKLIDSIRRVGTRHVHREQLFQEKEATLGRKLESDMSRNERIQMHMEEIPKSAAEVGGGLAMNQMLDLINNLGLEEDLLNMKEIPLEEGMAQDVRLRLGADKHAFTSPLYSHGDSTLSWDPPPSLMKSELRPLLEEHEQLRLPLFASAKEGKRPAEKDVAAANDSLDRITARLLELKPEEIASNTDPAYVVFKEGHQFVKEQSHQLGFLTTGTVQRKPFAGQSMQSLILYMTMYGLRFAPAPPGREHSYKAIFDGMHDVYSELRDEKRSIATFPTNPNELSRPFQYPMAPAPRYSGNPYQNGSPYQQ